MNMAHIDDHSEASGFWTDDYIQEHYPSKAAKRGAAEYELEALEATLSCEGAGYDSDCYRHNLRALIRLLADD
jgi:hypothetical protein